MSGGSFDYLYLCEDIGRPYSIETLEEMAGALRAYPAGEQAALDTEALIARLKAAVASDALRAVWHDVEWHHSGDFSGEAPTKALDEYNRQRNVERRATV